MLKSGFDVLTCSLVFLNYSLFVLHCSLVVLNCICQPRMTLVNASISTCKPAVGSDKILVCQNGGKVAWKGLRSIVHSLCQKMMGSLLVVVYINTASLLETP